MIYGNISGVPKKCLCPIKAFTKVVNLLSCIQLWAFLVKWNVSMGQRNVFFGTSDIQSQMDGLGVWQALSWNSLNIFFNWMKARMFHKANLVRYRHCQTVVCFFQNFGLQWFRGHFSRHLHIWKGNWPKLQRRSPPQKFFLPYMNCVIEIRKNFKLSKILKLFLWLLRIKWKRNRKKRLRHCSLFISVKIASIYVIRNDFKMNKN